MQNNFYIYVGLLVLGIFMYTSHQQVVSQIGTMEMRASLERSEILCKIEKNCDDESIEDLIEQLRSE